MDCSKILDSFGFNANTGNSVFLVDDFFNSPTYENLDANVLLALENARNFDVDAVYFRFFDDGRPPIPQLYIYDNTTDKWNNDFFTQKHKDIWSSCNVPAFIVVEKTEIKLYDTCAPVLFKGGVMYSSPVEKIDLSDISSAIQKFNVTLFNNGTFWEQKENRNCFTYTKGASQRLVSGLKKLREDFLLETPLPKTLSDNLLIICILIKYLEETGIDLSSQKNLASDFFKNVTGFADFIEIIKNRKITILLDALSNHFNGGIFSFTESDKRLIEKTDLSKLALFFEADYHNNLFGWREYSFEYIPVELISNFYEEFLDVEEKEEDDKKNKDGVVYTPSFLVNLLVDELLPLTKGKSENVKLIDPACGSGIFLATAFRRLVQRWRINNASCGKLGNPTPAILKKILSKNIFGVDKNKTAVNLTIFSLQLTLCSMLTPKQIWCELDKFDNLIQQKNIRCDDFLLTVKECRQQCDFDLVLGNPPYVQDRKDNGKYNDILKWEMSNPQSELALIFLEKGMQILKTTGKLCFLLPSGPLLYNTSSVQFRRDFFSKYNVTQIIDLIYFRRILFNATIATLAIFVENTAPCETTPIKHIVPKRTKVSKEKIFFEIDHYDFHIVPRSNELDDLSMWKSNILGGYLIYNIAKKFFHNFNSKIKDISHLRIYGSLSQKLRNKYKGICFNQSQSSLLDVINSSENYPNEKVVWCIKKSIKFDEKFPKELPVDEAKKDVLTFLGQKDSIDSLNKYLKRNNNLLRLLLAVKSKRQAVRSPYIIESQEFKDLPYIENQKVIEQYLSPRDEIIINDFVNYRLEALGKGEDAKINILDAERDDILLYSYTLCDELNKIYKVAQKEYFLSKCLQGHSFFYCEYKYGINDLKERSLHNTTKDISDLLTHWSPSRSCRYERIIRIYAKDKFIILKPKKLRYWLRSVALYDLDEMLKESFNG